MDSKSAEILASLGSVRVRLSVVRVGYGQVKRREGRLGLGLVSSLEHDILNKFILLPVRPPYYKNARPPWGQPESP